MTRIAPQPEAALRRTLTARREFRLEQLHQLDRQRPGRAVSGAHREIYVSLAVGARVALQEIEAALRRMDEGRYGLCVACGHELDLLVLEALPQTARCLPCQRARLADDASPPPSVRPDRALVGAPTR